MGKNALETVGDNATLSFGNTGTLTAGTLSAGVLTGVLGGAVVAVGSMTPLAGIYDISPNKISIKQVETTKLASAADESQPGTPDYGEVTVTVAHDAANITTVAGWIANKTVQFFKITVDDYSSTDTAETFLGWVKEYAPLSNELKKDETIKAHLTIKITGVPLNVAGS